eukprot:214724-Rhodomonas_salina.1
MQFTRFCTPLIKQADCLSIAVPQLLGQEGLSAELSCPLSAPLDNAVQILGDGVTMDEEEFAEVAKVMEDDQADIYKGTLLLWIPALRLTVAAGVAPLILPLLRSFLCPPHIFLCLH